MSDQDFTTTITVDQTPDEAFAAITDPRGWWSSEITGDTRAVGDEFIFDVPSVHWSRIRVTEAIPGRKVRWYVVDASLEFTDDKTEWKDTEIVFEISETGGGTEIRFTHVGLVPAYECYDICSNAWGSYIRGSLRSLISTGQGDPHREADTFESETRKHQLARS